MPRPAPSTASPPPPRSARWESSASSPMTRARPWEPSWPPGSRSPPRSSGCSWSARGVLATCGRSPAAMSASPSRSVRSGTGRQAGGYFAALQRLDASLLSLLVYTFPVMVTVTAIALGREPASRRTAMALVLASTGLVLVLAGAGAGALNPVGTGLGLGAALVYSAYILVSEGVAARVGPLVLSTLVCTGAAMTLTLAAFAAGDLDPGRVSAAGFAWLSGLAVVSTVGRHRSLLRRAATRGPDGRVDPVDPRAGRHRRAGVRRVRRIARPRAARRRCAGPLGGARCQDPPAPDSRRRQHDQVARRQGCARGGRDARGRARHGRGARGGRGDRVLHRPQHPGAALGIRPTGDDRGDRRAGERGRRHAGSRSRSTISSRMRSGRSSSGSTPTTGGSTSWSTTSGAASCCSSGTRRSGSTTSRRGCGCCAWRSTRT